MVHCKMKPPTLTHFDRHCTQDHAKAAAALQLYLIATASHELRLRMHAGLVMVMLHALEVRSGSSRAAPAG